MPTFPSRLLRTLIASLAGLSVASAVSAGPDVEEGGKDAGATPTVAKQAKGTGQVVTISGALSLGYVAGDIVDMFLVYVPNPSIFAAQTSQSTTPWDTQLWLFRVTFDPIGNPFQAFAIAGNDDDPGGGTLSSRVFFPPAVVTQHPPGVYAIAITPYRVRPFGLSTGGVPGELFTTTTTGGLFTPTGFGLERPLSYWDGVGSVVTPGPYKMLMTATTLIPPGGGLTACGDIFAGDCFAAHPTTKGCTDVDCCQVVCTVDPQCCNAAWDSLCAFIAQQNCAQCAPPNTCPADLNGDGIVNGADLGLLLTSWGVCP